MNRHLGSKQQCFVNLESEEVESVFENAFKLSLKNAHCINITYLCDCRVSCTAQCILECKNINNGRALLIEGDFLNETKHCIKVL